MNLQELSSSLRTAISTLHKNLRKQSATVSTYSLTETDTIAHLARNEKLLPTELASLTHITTQSMSQILSKMEEVGLVKKTPSKEDKRKVYVSLTASGKKMVEKTRGERDEWLKNAIEKSLSEKEKQVLEKAVPILNKLIEHK